MPWTMSSPASPWPADRSSASPMGYPDLVRFPRFNDRESAILSGDAPYWRVADLVRSRALIRHYRPVRRGTIVAMSTEPLRTVKDRFSEFVERVNSQHDRVVITRNGTPAAVLISPDDLEELEETLDLLSDRKAVRELNAARREVAAGDVVRGVDAVRKLRGR